MIRRVLVPNRGEIAARIARTCREMGIESVLGHAAEDVSPQARMAFDILAPLPGADVRQSYLDVDAIIDTARAFDCDAVHPGYGFLSERPALAAACAGAGITFIGPTPDAIELMGSKAASRQMMQKVGVPVIPGYDGDDQSEERLARAAGEIGFPLLVKASAGGGGKGMKIVRSPEELRGAIDSARREALKSFGDDRLLIERYLERPRHVEIQILGDASGEVVHLFERDCSVQRRHQKIIEESPAPDYPESLRRRMVEAAVTAGKAIGYHNAGTVEFLVTEDGEFFFLEMNTRLQVEHPVTESVVGIDLVRAQVDVANGLPLPWRQEELSQRGHAIECRIYAEDPDDGFLPQTGAIEIYREPEGPGLRVDSGVDAGSEVTVHFDPLLAKVIAHASDRNACIERMARALSSFVILGTRTNLSYLRRILIHPEFRAGQVTTAFISRHEEVLRPVSSPEAPAVALVLAAREPSSSMEPGGEHMLKTVWDSLGEWGR